MGSCSATWNGLMANNTFERAREYRSRAVLATDCVLGGGEVTGSW